MLVAALAGCQGTSPPPQPLTVPEVEEAPREEAPPEPAASAAQHAQNTGAASAKGLDLGVPEGACQPPETGDGGPPRVKMGEARVGFPSETVEHFVRKGARDTVQACVRDARERDRGLQGRIWLQFDLPAAGGIAHAEVMQGVGDAALFACVKEAFEKAPMPALQGAGTMNVTRYAVVVCPDGRARFPAEGGYR
jgi:outer membrane biosynthesis protein TonB